MTDVILPIFPTFAQLVVSKKEYQHKGSVMSGPFGHVLI